MSSVAKEQIISNIYYDSQDGYSSIQNSVEQVKKVDPTILYEEKHG